MGLLLYHAISIGLALGNLIAVLAVIVAALRAAGRQEQAAARRNLLLSLIAFFVLIAVAIAIILVDFERNPLRATVLGLGTILAGVVPVALWMILAFLPIAGLQGEGPVALSAASRHALRVPLIGGVVIALGAATLLIALGGREPPVWPLQYLALGALALACVGLIWPMLVLQRGIARDRQRDRAG